jgi:pullulanase/glycogen debranching enzyme
VDGFRFDLAELIDWETMREVEREARKLNPRVMLISEPWSFRGNHKARLKGTTWSAWNDDFRESVKRYAAGGGSRDAVRKAVAGSLGFWTAHPLQAVNYLESHDDMALMDELSLRPDHDGRYLTAENTSVNRMAATVLFTSLGIPMLTEGQEFLRGKQGVRNTFNRGDALNSVRFTDADRPFARESLAYYRGLSALRASEAGASLRARETSPDYFDWIQPADERQLGWIVNARGSQPGAAFLVLLNTAPEPAQIDATLPAGEWVPVSDGLRLDPNGLGPARAGGPQRFPVAPRSAVIWMKR